MAGGHDILSDTAGRTISKTELFLGFLEIGLLGFGGLAAISRHVIVVKRKWLSERDYAAVFSISQALPGGNVINVAAILGDRFRGLPGAISAVIGLFAAPLALLVVIAVTYDQFSDLADVKLGSAGAAAAAAGLVVGTAVRMMRALRLSHMAKGFAAAAFVSVAVLRFPLVWTVAALLPLCVAMTLKWRPK